MSTFFWYASVYHTYMHAYLPTYTLARGLCEIEFCLIWSCGQGRGLFVFGAPLVSADQAHTEQRALFPAGGRADSAHHTAKQLFA